MSITPSSTTATVAPTSFMSLTAQQEKWLLILLIFIQLTHIVDFMLLMPLGPLLSVDLHIRPDQFGLLVSVYSILAGVSGLVGALTLHKLNRKKILLLAYAFFTLFTLASGLVSSFYALLLMRGAAGFAGGFLGGLVQIIISESIPFERRGKAMGWVMSAFSIATVAGIPFGLLLASHFGWRAPLISLAALSTVIWVCGLYLLPNLIAPIKTDSALTALKQTLMVPKHWLAYGYSSLLAITSFSVIPFITLYNVHNLNVTQDQIKFIYIFGGIATLLSGRLIGVMSDRHGKARVLGILILLAIFPLWGFTHLTTPNLPIIILVTTLFFVLVSGRNIPAMALISEVAPAQLRSSFMSLHSAFQAFAMGFAALLGGKMIEMDASGRISGYGHLGWLAVGLSVIAYFMIPVLISATAKGEVKA